jgi:hypothetical protein
MEVELFSPHKGQLKIIEGFADSTHKFGVVATGRQFGKSLLAQNLMMYWLLSETQQKGAWIAPVYNQCKKIFDELTIACYELIEKQNRADLTINFINGSTLHFLSTDNYNTIRGFSFNYMVIDEAAFVKQEAIEQAVMPTLTALGKKCLIISTPKSKNWFYEYFLRGNTQNPTYIAFKGRSHDNPYVDQSFIEEQRKSLPATIYNQEYDAEFTDAGNDVFTNIAEACVLNNFTYEPTRGIKYFAGVDLGLTNDYSVLTIMDEFGRVLIIERINGTSYADITKTFTNTIKRYGVCGGYVEVNGPGKPVFEVLHSHEKKLREFVTTNTNKMDGIRGLIYDIQESKIELPSKDLFPQLFNELSSFTYKINPTGTVSFSSPSGMNDDCVMSLMLANEARKKLIFSSSKLYIGNKHPNIKPKFG